MTLLITYKVFEIKLCTHYDYINIYTKRAHLYTYIHVVSVSIRLRKYLHFYYTKMRVPSHTRYKTHTHIRNTHTKTYYIHTDMARYYKTS